MHIRSGESDVAAVRQVFRDGGYAIDFSSPAGSRIFGRYEEILAAGKTPVIVDAGANIGAATLFFQSQFPQAHIVSIEPEPGNLKILQKNTAGCSHVHIMHAAIGSTDGFVSVINDGLGWSARTERSTTGLPIITMKRALSVVPNSLPLIVKIDIEGFESDLFSDNIEWLDETFVVHIEPHDYAMPATSLSFQRAMGRGDFEIFIQGDTLTYVRIRQLD